MKNTIILLLALFSTKIQAKQKQDTINVYFDLAIPSLNNTAMQYLDSLAYYNVLPTNKEYGIIGYADYLGSEESNILLSEKRAKAVKDYLTGLGVAPQKIKTVVGKGEVSRDTEASDGYPTDRRVDIVIGGFKHIPIDSMLSIKLCKCGDTNCRYTKHIKTPVKRPAKLDISKVEKNETIALKNIFFLPGSHRIREESTEPLFELYITMSDNPNLKINIEGHICCLKNTTNDGYDYDVQEYGLSRNRAKAVYDYLISKGIDKERMNYEGFGITRPLIWPERSLADENLNRRVELRVIDK